MTKNFGLNRAFCGYPLNLFFGKFARQHNAAKADIGKKCHPVGGVDAELRGCVKFDVGSFHQLVRKTEILHDERIYSCRSERFCRFQRQRHFSVRNKRIQHRMDADSAFVAKRN